MNKTNNFEEKKKFIQLLKDSGEWVPVVERDICFLIRYLILNGEKSDKYNKALGKNIPPIGDAIVKGYVFSLKSSAINTSKILQEIITKEDYKSFIKISRECVQKAKELHEFLNNNLPISKDTLVKFKELYSNLTSYLLIIVFAERLLESKTEELIKTKTGKIDKRYYEALVYTEKFNQNTKELIDILELSSKIKDKNLSLKENIVLKKIQLHAEKYGWLGTRWKFEKEWNPKDIQLRIENYLKENPSLELKNVLSPREEANKITAEFIEKFSLNNYEKDFIKIVKEFVYLRTFRTESMARANSLFKTILEKIGKKYGYTIEELSDLSVDEIISIITENKDYKKLISDRKSNGYYMVLYNDTIVTFVGDEKKLVDDIKIFNIPEIINRDIIGQTAWKGKVKGKVKVIKDQSDIIKVQKGDILVAVMTFPNYIPAMEKAAAFVTNEGGILCHAAIVSREMKKPCIIGTKIATKVLKDGDEVEIDADKGIVRIIKKSD